MRARAAAAAPPVRIAKGGKHRVGDLLQDGWGAPLIGRAGMYTPKGQKLLSLELPDDLPDNDRTAILGFVAKNLGRFVTPEAAAGMGGGPEVAGPTQQQVAQEAYNRSSLGGKMLLQMAAGIERVAPQPIAAPTDLVPKPQSLAEHAAGFAGTVGTYALEVAALRKLPFLKPVAGSPLASSVRGGAAAAMAAGASRAPDLSSRLVSAGTMGVTSGLSEFIPLSIYKAAVTRAATKVAPAFAEAAGASRAASIAQALKAAAGTVPGMTEADQALAARLAAVTGERAAGAARGAAVAGAAALTGAQRAAAVGGAVGSTLIFGPLSAYMEYGGEKITGHDVELPTLKDVLTQTGMVAATSLLHLPMQLRGVGVEPERIEPLGPGPAGPELLPGGTTPPSPVAPWPVPRAAAPAVDAIRQNALAKLGNEPNPFAGGLTPTQAFNKNFTDAVQAVAAERGKPPEALTPDEFRIAAARASSKVGGLETLKQVMTLPKLSPADPDAARKLNNRVDATARANKIMAGKQATISLPVKTSRGVVQVPTDATIVHVEMAPDLREGALRVLVQEGQTGKLVPLSFDNVEAMARDIRFPAPTPASAEPVGRLTTSRMATVPPGTPPPTAVGAELARGALTPTPKPIAGQLPLKAGKGAAPAEPVDVWREARGTIKELAGDEGSAATELWTELRAGRPVPPRAVPLLERLRSMGMKVKDSKVRELAKRVPNANVFRKSLRGKLMKGLEGRIRELGRSTPEQGPTASPPSPAPTPPAPATGPPPEPPSAGPPAVTQPKPAPTPPAPKSIAPEPLRREEPKGPKVGERVEVGEHRGVVIDQAEGKKTVLLDSGRTVQAADVAVKPEAPKEITHYPSQSRGGEPLRISTMAGSHLVNAEAKQPAGPLKEALRAEIGRRGIVPKEAPVEPAKPAAPAAAAHPAQPRAAPSGGTVERGAGGERNARARVPVKGQGGERIAVARAEFTHDVDESGVPADLRGFLTPYQLQGAAKALAAMNDQARRAFLLADGTGVGKTRQALAVAEAFRREGRLVVVFTPNEVVGKPWEAKSLKAHGGKAVITGSYAQDAAAMGISVNLWRPKDGPMPLSGIVLTTYTYMTDPAITENHNAVYVFDESHALKNASAGTALAVKGRTLANASYATLFMSATPADKPTHIEYLARIGILEGKTLRDAVYGLGFRLAEKGGRTFWVPQKNIKTEEILKRMSALFDRMTDKGSMVKREIGLDGVDIHFRRLGMPREMHQTLAKIAAHFDESNPRQRAIMLMHQRRQQEPEKAKVALEIARKEIAAGRRVILFVARVNESEVKVQTGKTATGEKTYETITSSEGTAKLLRAMLTKEGIPFAELHGAADVHAAEAMASFQTGNAKVLVATVESGGTGINLDDTVGDAPRTLIMVTAPFNGVTNVQAAGRVWRMTTKSLPRIVYLFGDTPVDDWNAAIIAKKMETLGANVSGQVKRLLIDPDLLNETEPEDIGSLMSGEIGGEMREPPAPVTTPPPEEPPPQPAKFTPPKPTPAPPTTTELAEGTHEALPREWTSDNRDDIRYTVGQVHYGREILKELEAKLAKGTVSKRKGGERKLTGKERTQLEEDVQRRRDALDIDMERVRAIVGDQTEEAIAQMEREAAEIAALPESSYSKKTDEPMLDYEGKQEVDDAGNPLYHEELVDVQPTAENVDKYQWSRYGKAMVNGKEHDISDAVAYFKFGKFPWQMSQDEYDRWLSWAEGPFEGADRVSLEDSAHVSGYAQVQAGLMDIPISDMASTEYNRRRAEVFHAAFKGEEIPEAVKNDFPFVRRMLPPDKHLSDADADAYMDIGSSRKKGETDEQRAVRAEAARAKLRAKHGLEMYGKEHIDHYQLEKMRDQWYERRVEYQGEPYRVGFVHTEYDPEADRAYFAADLQDEYDYDNRDKRVDDVPITELKKLPEPPDWETRDDRMERIHKQDAERRSNRSGENIEFADNKYEQEREAAGTTLEEERAATLSSVRAGLIASYNEVVAAREIIRRATAMLEGADGKKKAKLQKDINAAKTAIIHETRSIGATIDEAQMAFGNETAAELEKLVADLNEPAPTKPPAGTKLEQTTMEGMPAPQIPGGAKPTGPAPPLELGGEAQTFEQAFEAQLRAGEEPAFASLEAARISGQNEPEGFDAEKAASMIRRRMLEEVGQGDLFGNSPLLGAEGRVGVAGVPRGALQDIEARPDLIGNGKSGVWDQNVLASDIRTHTTFQNRDTLATLGNTSGPVPVESLVNNENINALYKAEGGFNPDLIRANPPLLWKDTLGELGEKDALWLLSGHHRVAMWKQNLPDEPMPAKVMGGSLASAQRVAQLSNRQGVANTHSELARLAYTAMKKGEDDARTAAQLKVSVSELERLVNFYHVDAELRSVYFPPGAEVSIMEPVFGSALGEQVRKNPDVFTKQIQDDFLRRVLGSSDMPPLSLMQFRAAMTDWKKKIADRLPQERAAELLAGGGGYISPSAWLAATERLTFDIQASVADARATMVGILKQYVPESSLPKKMTQEAIGRALRDYRHKLPEHVRATLSDISTKLGQLKEVEDEVEARGRTLLQKIMDGLDIADDLSAIKKFIVEKIGTPMRDALNEGAKGGPMGGGFGALEPTINWLLRRAAERTHKAAEAVMRRLGRKARTIYVKDHGTGATLAKYELTMDPTTDPASEMAMYRAGAVSGIMGSYVSMPPYARGETLRMQAARDYLPDFWEQRLYEIMGDSFIRDVQQYYPGDAHAFDALEKKDTPQAKTMLAKYGTNYTELRKFLTEIHDYVKEVSEQAGIPAPGFIENYAPHVFEGEMAKGVDRLAEFFYDRKMDDAEKRQLAKRFFDHREGDENYRRSFWLALRTYARFAGHYVAKVRFLSKMKTLLSSEWAKGDPQRAAEVRRTVVRSVWQQEDSIGRFINDATRSAFWSNVAGGVDAITADQAAAYLGETNPGGKWAETIALRHHRFAGARFAYALKGVKPNFTDPRLWVKLGDTKHGSVYAGTGGHAFGPAHSELTPWMQKMLDLGLELKVRSNRKFAPEDAVAAMLRQRDRSTRLSRQPGNYLVSWLGRRISTALVGLSVQTTLVNFTGLLTHVYTRYGALSMLRGGLRFGAGSAVTAVRGLASYLEHHNLIDPKLASAIYRSTPYMREQLLLEAGGLRQGFALSLEKMLEKIEAGQHSIDVRVAKLATNWMQGAELVIRGWSVMAAADAAESRGHTWGNVKAWVGRSNVDRDRAIQDLMGQLSDPKSVVSYAAENEYFTNFFYNQLGQNPGMGIPWFKTVLGLFSTFPWSTFVHKDLRGLLGASRTVSAGIRSALGRTPTEKPMRGSVQGANYDVPRMAPREPYGGRAKGDPFGPFAEFFRKGGMSYFDRQAAIEFARSMFVSGALAAAGAVLGINALIAYSPFAFMLVLAILKMFYPDNEQLAKAIQNAEAGQAFRAGHGGMVAGSPVINAIEGARAGDDWGQVLWNATLGRVGDLVRMAALGKFYRSGKGILEQNPETFDTDQLRWLYDAFGVKSALYDLTLQQKAMRTLGILDEDTIKEHRRLIRPRESRGAGPPPPPMRPAMAHP